MIAAGVLPLEEQLTRTVLIIQNKFWWFWGFELPAVTDHDRFSTLPGRQVGMGVDPTLDAGAVLLESERAHQLGFGAKLCIHPQQIDAARQAFVPSAEAQAWAHRVVDAWEKTQHSGAVQVDARMVDKPVYLRAQRLLAQAPNFV
jgi:hypothetical protein